MQFILFNVFFFPPWYLGGYLYSVTYVFLTNTVLFQEDFHPKIQGLSNSHLMSKIEF